MFVFIILLVIVGVVLCMWLKPYLEYKKIGSYADYISKTPSDKELEYSWYQINGFKNIDTEAIKYLHQLSRCCTKKDLQWIRQCKAFLEEGLIEAEENDASKLFVNDPQNASLIEILKVIKRCRKPLSSHYQKIGCFTCGEAVVMHIWFSLRLEQIENDEAIKSGDLDYIIDDVKKIKNSCN